MEATTLKKLANHVFKQSMTFYRSIEPEKLRVAKHGVRSLRNQRAYIHFFKQELKVARKP
eukprot:snap_masked-scaffold_36-processed-gene-0.30-mRNA-1 protein AED:1.00 eAED:1.00 QI:0/-1/0/0/-1/1/1/0/59